MVDKTKNRLELLKYVKDEAAYWEKHYNTAGKLHKVLSELKAELAEEAISLHTDPRSHSTLVLNSKLLIREVLDKEKENVSDAVVKYEMLLKQYNETNMTQRMRFKKLIAEDLKKR